MIRPQPLVPGDVVRVVAPSGPFDRDMFERGLDMLRERFRLEPRVRPDVTARARYLAGDDRRRTEEWLEAISDPAARAIWCARGGYGAMRLLPRLEPARLLRSPKLVIGFSDITAIHGALNTAGLATVHGPMVAYLPRLAPEALEHLEALLFGRSQRTDTGLPGAGAGCIATGVIRPGRATGPLLGGSLTLLAHLCGTGYLPTLAGAVLFIEDVGEKPYRLDRYLTQLRLSGVLDGVAGVCVGQLTDCDDSSSTLPTVEDEDEPGVRGADVVRDIVGSLGVPAIEGIQAGHERMNLALPLGSRVTVVAPGDGRGAPHLLFDEGATA